MSQTASDLERFLRINSIIDVRITKLNAYQQCVLILYPCSHSDIRVMVTVESQWGHSGVTVESQWSHSGVTVESQ